MPGKSPPPGSCPGRTVPFHRWLPKQRRAAVTQEKHPQPKQSSQCAGLLTMPVVLALRSFMMSWMLSLTSFRNCSATPGFVCSCVMQRWMLGRRGRGHRLTTSSFLSTQQQLSPSEPVVTVDLLKTAFPLRVIPAKCLPEPVPSSFLTSQLG